MKSEKLSSPRAVALCLALLCAPALAAARTNNQTGRENAQAAAPAASSPTDVARAFYTALRESRFRDALLMSVYRPAIESLSAEEVEELRPDFERLAAQVSPDFEFTGETFTGEEATVFMKTGSEQERNVKVEPVYLTRVGGAWVVGTPGDAVEVRKLGKKFFFEKRIAAHEQDAEDMLKRIQAAEIAYSLQNAGLYGDLDALVRAGFVPQDILGTETTGYRFTVTTAADKKSFAARAEPASYNRTGRLSFYMDKSGIQRKDAGGKPLSPGK